MRPTNLRTLLAGLLLLIGAVSIEVALRQHNVVLAQRVDRPSVLETSGWQQAHAGAGMLYDHSQRIQRQVPRLAADPSTQGDHEIPDKAALAKGFDEHIRPLLQKYCIRCHDEDMHSGNTRIDNLSGEITAENDSVWTDVKNMLSVGSMPPNNKLQPAREEQDEILIWIDHALNLYDTERLETGGDTLVRRINNRAYANMIQTLLGVPAQEMERFPPDGYAYGFDTVGSGLYTTESLYELYLQSAQKTLELAITAEASAPSVLEKKIQPIDSPRGLFRRECHAAAEEVKALRKDPKRYKAITIENAFTNNYTGFIGLTKSIVAAHYGLKTIAEVNKKGIDWADDPKCIDAIVSALTTESERLKSLDETLSDFQPARGYNSPGYPIYFEIGVKINDPGYYVISARLCLSDSNCPLPVAFLVEKGGKSLGVIADFGASKVVNQFMLYDPQNAPQTYEAKAFLPKGDYTIRIRSGVEMAIQFWEYVNAMYGSHFERLDFLGFDINTKQGSIVAANLNQIKSPRFYQLPRTLVGDCTVRGPVYDTWPPPAASRIFTRGMNASPTRDYAEEIVLSFMKRAYACKCDAAMAQDYVDFIMSHFESSKNFIESVKYGLAAVLSSPRFLYLDEEQRTDSARRKPLNAFELSRRLAYFLWSDLPDDALLASAASGALLGENELLAQLRRMIKDPRSRAFREAFTTQWLKIDKLESFAVSRELFPATDAVFMKSAKDESVAFFSELLDNNLSILNFIDSDFAMLNGRMAFHYGIPRIAGNEFRRVQLSSGSHRGGVLTQASVLMTTSNGMVSSLVKRGVFIMENLLGVSPGSPPPNVPALEKTPTEKADGTLLTPIERLSKHRGIVSCARCHDKIDPLGVGLENFNAVGSWNAKLAVLRTNTPNKGQSPWEEHDADVRGTMLDGTPYNGSDDLKRQLMSHKNQFTRCFVEKLMIYALGRGMENSDQPVLDRLCERVEAENYGLSTLVESVILSELFRNK